ncbi:hypothetical protein JCM5350_007116, partial [Sporobolomyces pararoseus]
MPPKAKLNNTKPHFLTSFEDAALNKSNGLLNGFVAEVCVLFDGLEDTSSSSLGAALRDSIAALKRYRAADQFDNPYISHLWDFGLHSHHLHNRKLLPDLKTKSESVKAARLAVEEEEKKERVFIETFLHYFTKVIGEILDLGSNYEVRVSFTDTTKQYKYYSRFAGDALKRFIARCAYHRIVQLILPSTLIEDPRPSPDELRERSVKVSSGALPRHNPLSLLVTVDAQLDLLRGLRLERLQLVTIAEEAIGPFSLESDSKTVHGISGSPPPIRPASTSAGPSRTRHPLASSSRPSSNALARPT